MARYEFRLPDIGEGVAEAEIVAWHVKPGDRVREDQLLADVMTDKATVDMSSPVDGKIIACHGEVGERIAIGAVLVELDVDQDQPVTQSPAPANAPATDRHASYAPINRHAAAALAAPATRQKAKRLGIALDQITGTGPDGRITPDDVDRAADKPMPDLSGGRTGITAQKIMGLRRAIADRTSEAARRIPHFLYVETIDITALEARRAEINAGTDGTQPHLTLLPFLMRAIAVVQPEFPQFNAHYDDEAGILLLHHGVHIGIATQSPNGLMVPVVRHVEAMDVFGCARELARVTNAAREGRAMREELSGSTITLTSLGRLGGMVSSPIINWPEVAIIGPNRAEQRAIVIDGQITVRRMMNVSSSFDHRIIDGHDAARFIQRLKEILETGEPV